MDQIEIKVVKLEFGEGVVKSSFDVGWIMLSIPELRCDEDILPLKALDIFQRAFDTLRDFFLILIAVIGGKTSQLPCLR